MAKTKSKSGAAPGAPKPKIEPPKPPVIPQRFKKWIPVVVVALVVAVLTPIIVSRSGRGSALQTYDEALNRALLPFTQHQAETLPDSFLTLPAQFADGTVTPKRLDDVAERWAKDFTEAANNVRALDPLKELDVANGVFAQAMDSYAGVARLYRGLADEKRLELASSGKAKKRVEDQVSFWLKQIQGAQSRAQAQLALGRGLVDQLRFDWGVESTVAAIGATGRGAAHAA